MSTGFGQVDVKETHPRRIGWGDRDGDNEPTYLLGSDEAELERLSLQGRILAPATRAILVEAGIEAGMTVLDLGSGAGDVSLAVAELVGREGQVIGIDSSPEAVALANRRAAQSGMANVRFVEGDIHDPAPGGPFDAVTGRLILMHVPDPVNVLRAQATVLRPGGLVIPQEIDVENFRTIPPTPLGDRVTWWVVETFKRSGRPISFGSSLWSLMEESGLPPEGMIGVQSCVGPDDPANAALRTGIVRTMLALIERTGVATQEEIDITSLNRRLADEVNTARAVLPYPPLFSAWARVPD